MVSLAASDLDERLLGITGLSGTIFGVANVVVSALSIGSWIKSHKAVGCGPVVLMVSMSLWDLLLAPGALGVIPIMAGWKVLDKQKLQMTMALRDVIMMTVSVHQSLALAVLLLQRYLQKTGTPRLSSWKASLGLEIFASLYSLLLIMAPILHYGLKLDGMFGLLSILQLPLAWLPNELLQAWYLINVLLWNVASVVLLILIVTKGANAVQPMNNSTQADTPADDFMNKVLIIHLVFGVLCWIPYGLYTSLTMINLMAFTFQWIHIYHFFYIFALLCSFLRPLLTTTTIAEMRKATKSLFGSSS